MEASNHVLATGQLNELATAAEPSRARQQAQTRSSNSTISPGAKPAGITVRIADPAGFGAVADSWRDLVSRAAEPNVFQEPAFANAASRHLGQSSITLLAWQGEGTAQARLLGAWTLRISRPRSRLPIRILNAPLVYDYTFLTTPVLDSEMAVEVLTAMLDTISAERSLPKILVLQKLGADGPVMVALQQVLAARSTPMVVLSQVQRPKLDSTLDGPAYFQGALSSGSRKKMRQHRRRLSEQHGEVRTITRAGTTEGTEAFERFLELEFAGWKGQAGTAVLCRQHDAAFAREAFRSLGAEGSAWVEALQAGDRVIATQVLMRSGRGAFTWKIAHDERFGDFSPGVLLVEDYTTKLLADPALDFADSCSFGPQGFMADLWKEQQSVVDLCFDARPGRSAAFRAVAASEQMYGLARQKAKDLKARLERARGTISARRK